MGITPTEAYLTELAGETFLSMWSFPNPGYGQPTAANGGKELCDLLVVFKDNVILFSDKSCEYPLHAEPIIAWKRWYRRSIAASVRQLIGAKKTIEKYPERVFLDESLQLPFPIRLPETSSRRIFLVAVTHESTSLCQQLHHRSSLKIDTRLTSDEEVLAVGCHNQGNFVHVLARHLFPDRKTIIGIAIPNPDCKEMNSNFIRILDGSNWTAEDDQMAEQLHKRNGVFAGATQLVRYHFE